MNLFLDYILFRRLVLPRTTIPISPPPWPLRDHLSVPSGKASIRCQYSQPVSAKLTPSSPPGILSAPTLSPADDTKFQYLACLCLGRNGVQPFSTSSHGLGPAVPCLPPPSACSRVPPSPVSLCHLVHEHPPHPTSAPLSLHLPAQLNQGCWRQPHPSPSPGGARLAHAAQPAR